MILACAKMAHVLYISSMLSVGRRPAHLPHDAPPKTVSCTK
ncbi:hypothetical protein NSE_0819 [Neorickettsia sennetsu str. Miyayama]|uniref:Uncharacterized protein n=1 Tax=Ehrlichia sennetsu (strain ATCC VR-367 / Miyayama) TaxID=222891 RepID=Q2GCV5_EHRS3|nr:hypothetical protein NSE_0819 [Neorickettsia sennetsu str. Miyayama]